MATAGLEVAVHILGGAERCAALVGGSKRIRLLCDGCVGHQLRRARDETFGAFRRRVAPLRHRVDRLAGAEVQTASLRMLFVERPALAPVGLVAQPPAL